jgi:nitrate/TMAO reductase-like tetraheme cytochrome c subunit
MSKTLGRRIAEKCVDCHMPKQLTNAIIAKTAGNQWTVTADLIEPQGLKPNSYSGPVRPD